MQDVTDQVSLPSVHCMWDIPLLLDSSLYFISHTMVPTDLLHPSRAPDFKHPRDF